MVDARGEESAKERNVVGRISLFVGGPDSYGIRIMEGKELLITFSANITESR